MKNFSSKNLYLIRIIVNKLRASVHVKPIDLSKIAGLAIMGCPMTKFVIYCGVPEILVKNIIIT